MKRKIEQDLIVAKRILQPNFNFYQQLINNLMFTINDCTVAQSAMLDQCRYYFSLYNTHLNYINKFAKTYQATQAAHWYTKDCFIHRIINKVLRAGNIEQSSLLRFYVADLSNQLYQLKCQQQKDVIKTEQITILYRGLRQSEEHLQILQSLVGEIILTKDFMSTSRDKRIALFYAAVAHPQSLQSQPLLIEISVDMSAPDIIAADIAHLSKFFDEQEVLFDIGAQFRVKSLEYDSSNLIWHCQLEAVSSTSQVISLFQHISSDQCYADLSTYSKDEAKLERIMRRERRDKFLRIDTNPEYDSLWSNSPSISWIANSSSDRARILQQKALMNWQRTSNLNEFHSECKNSWELFKQGISGISNDNHDTACFLNNFGHTCQQLHDTNYAIDLLKQAFEMRDRLRTSEHFRAQSLRNLGLAYTDQGNYENALTFLNQALIIGLQARPSSQWSTSMTLRNFVYVYHSQGGYQRAIEYSFKAIETFKKCASLCIQHWQA
jgi:tetratricopeptide (TPR) repeat protein